MIIVPVLLALAINAFVPGINETTVRLAMLEEDTEYAVYMEQFAHIETFATVDDVQNRIEKRDNIVAILPEGDEYYIMTQGNEPEGVVEFAKLLKTFYELDLKVEETTAEIIEFGRTVPPMKKLWVNMAIMLTSVLGGMLIALNIVEEKVDNTISAINVSPVSRRSFILGKCTIGVLVPIAGSISILLITGFGKVNLGQAALMVGAATLLSMLIGFFEGLRNSDVMNVMANIKSLFIPLIAAVAVKELVADKWQFSVYWNPYYWAYSGNDEVLSLTATWPKILMYVGLIIVICGLIYFYLAPKIRKGLE